MVDKMYSLLFIAKNNLKKKKGDVAVLVLLITVSALLLYTSISILTGITKVVDTAYEQAHTADYLYVSDSSLKEKIKKLLLEQNEVVEYEQNKVLSITGEYRNSLSEVQNNYMFYIQIIEEERNISILPEIEIENNSHNAILLPYYLKFSYEKGDSFYLTLGDWEYQFIVAGFVEDPMFSTPLNVPLYNIYITNNYMNTILNEHPALKENIVSIHKVRLKEGTDTKEFENKIMNIFRKKVSHSPAKVFSSINWNDMRAGGSAMSYMIMGIVLIFSVLLILVVLIIMRFSIRNFIERNLKNIGILQASGYTIKQLRVVSILEMGIIAFISCIAGIVLGVLGSSMIGDIEGMISGLSWNQNINVKVAILVVLLILLTVITAAQVSSRVYKKITVLDALRGGIHTHNFRKNFFPLEKSRLPLSIVLSGKEILGEKKKNISILCIIIILAVTSCIGFALYENFALNTNTLLNLIGIEIGNVSVSGKDIEKVAKEVKDWEEIDFTLSYCEMSLKLTHGDNQCTLSCDIWDNPDLLQHEIVVEGRLPKYHNEIVITTNAAKELDVSVGDVIYVEGQQKKMDYLITGIDQKINHIGLKALLTIDGLKRLNGTVQATELYLYTKEGISYKTIQEKIEQQSFEVELSDTQKAISETISSIDLGMIAICGVLISITCFVVILVEILLIQSKIAKEWKNYGISKALGYTTKQLIVQTMMTNIPVVFTGTIIGVLISRFLGNRLALICFAMFGLEKIELLVNPIWIGITIIGILFVAILTSFLASIKIRKIEPITMLMEE